MTLRTLADGAAARLRARGSGTPEQPAGPARAPGRDAAGPAARRLVVGRLVVGRPAGLAPHAWPALAGLGLGLLALGPGLAPGFLLSYDMVFVPGMPFSAALTGLTGGPPRAVPSDAAVAVASLLVPADVLQKLILLAIFVVACSGAAALLSSGWAAAGRAAAGGAAPGAAVPGAPLAARLAAGVFYAWNPYLAERLLIGQWALLLGYAGLPWVLRLLCTGQGRTSPVRLIGVMLPAAVGGFAAMGVTMLGAVPAAVGRSGEPPGERARRLATAAGCAALLSLPWLVPAFAVAVHTDPRGVDAFAARADTPFGRLGSLLMLSGIWNAQTVPPGYGGADPVIWLAVVAAALCGYLLLARPRGIARGLGAGALAGLAIAAIGVAGPGRAALRDLVAAWPGFAVLRDGQQFVAPLALAEAVGLGALVAWIVTGAPRAAGARTRAPAAGVTPAAGRATAALAVMAVLAPVVLLPGMAWGMAGRLRPVQYPADWLRARQVIDAGPAPGTVLLLPWAAYRRYPWNNGEAVYDPWPRLLGREVISNDGLQVGTLTLAQESADSIRLNRIVSAPGPLTAALRAAGVRYVVVDAGPLLDRPPAGRAGLAALARLPGARLVTASRDLAVFRLSPAPGRHR